MGKLLSPALLSLSFCLVLVGSSLASSWQEQFDEQNECQFQELHTLQPDHVIKSEAGLIETWDPNHKQFRCTGAAMSRCTLQHNALRLPSYSNAPQLFFIRRGSGVFGLIFPGCANTFEEPMQQSSKPDRHQKLHYFKEGDVIAVPTGVAFWIFNFQETPVETISILYTDSKHNQLDRMPRRFYLAGNQEQEFLHYQRQQQQGGSQQQQQGGSQQQQNEGNNMLSGFTEDFLTQAFNVDRKTAQKLQGVRDDREGGIVKIEGGLRILSPRQQGSEEGEEQESSEGRQGQGENALEETLCTMSLRKNIGRFTTPDIFNRRAGSIKTVNSLDLPVLKWLGLSAEYGSIRRNALYVPHYNLNAHSIICALSGRARIQVVDCSGNTVFDGQLEEGQVLTVPQNFALAVKSQCENFRYVAFKTNGRAMMAPLAGRTSVIASWPEEVVQHAFQLERQQARQLKNNNNDFSFLVPPSRTQSRRSQSESESESQSEWGSEDKKRCGESRPVRWRNNGPPNSNNDGSHCMVGLDEYAMRGGACSCSCAYKDDEV
ncbi:glycinin G3 [Senna tora]|uniref:Glycinin G3 n=1 Tax=Senna tora TaxID=362788 RepID=A0A834TBD1_9FABA|nr:glycinin G3 [Senna tora]